MNHKALFLDIDGVLNHSKSPLTHGVFDIDGQLLHLLDKIIKATGALIILSSSWRRSKISRARVDAHLATIDLTVHDITPTHLVGDRSEEINFWLNNNPHITTWAIVDDDRDAGTNGQEKNFFKTTWEVGLTETTADAIIQHLNTYN